MRFGHAGSLPATTISDSFGSVIFCELGVPLTMTTLRRIRVTPYHLLLPTVAICQVWNLCKRRPVRYFFNGRRRLFRGTVWQLPGPTQLSMKRNTAPIQLTDGMPLLARPSQITTSRTLKSAAFVIVLIVIMFAWALTLGWAALKVAGLL